MTLIDDAWLVLRKAWSIRLALIGAALAGVEMALPLFADAFPRHIFLGLSIFVTVSGVVARLVDQPRMRRGR